MLEGSAEARVSAILCLFPLSPVMLDGCSQFPWLESLLVSLRLPSSWTGLSGFRWLSPLGFVSLLAEWAFRLSLVVSPHVSGFPVASTHPADNCGTDPRAVNPPD